MSETSRKTKDAWPRSAAIGLLWGALLVAIGVTLLLVAALVGVLLVAGAAGFQRRAFVASLAPRLRRIDWPRIRATVGRRASAARRLAASGSRRAVAAGGAAVSAVEARGKALQRDLAAKRATPPPAPGRRDALRLNEQAAALRTEERLGEALESSEQALAIFRSLGDRHGEALTLNGLGLTQARIGDEAGALDSYETAVALLTELGDGHGAGRVLANLGALHRGQGHEAQARAAWNDALERLEPGSPEHDRTAQQLRLAS